MLVRALTSGGSGDRYERYVLQSALGFQNYIDIPISGTPKMFGFIGSTVNGYNVAYMSDTEYASQYGIYGGYKSSSANNAAEAAPSAYFTVSNGNLRFTNNIDTSINAGFEIIIGY